MSHPLPRALLAASIALCSCTADGGGGMGRDAGAVAKKPVPGNPGTDVTAEDWVGPPLPHARVTLTDGFGQRHVVDAEVAATEKMRTRGMMWRTVLEDGKGMLFAFTGDEVHSFWMRNTLIPLDMLFIDKDGVVVGIVRNAAPKTLSSRSVGLPSRYVLEVPGGWCERKSIDSGARAEFEGLSVIPVE